MAGRRDTKQSSMDSKDDAIGVCLTAAGGAVVLVADDAWGDNPRLMIRDTRGRTIAVIGGPHLDLLKEALGG